MHTCNRGVIPHRAGSQNRLEKKNIPNMVDWLVSGNSTAPYKKFKTSEIKAFIFIWAFVQQDYHYT